MKGELSLVWISAILDPYLFFFPAQGNYLVNTHMLIKNGIYFHVMKNSFQVHNLFRLRSLCRLAWFLALNFSDDDTKIRGVNLNTFLSNQSVNGSVGLTMLTRSVKTKHCWAGAYNWWPTLVSYMHMGRVLFSFHFYFHIFWSSGLEFNLYMKVWANVGYLELLHDNMSEKRLSSTYLKHTGCQVALMRKLIDFSFINTSQGLKKYLPRMELLDMSNATNEIGYKDTTNHDHALSASRKVPLCNALAAMGLIFWDSMLFELLEANFC